MSASLVRKGTAHVAYNSRTLQSEFVSIRESAVVPKAHIRLIVRTAPLKQKKLEWATHSMSDSQNSVTPDSQLTTHDSRLTTHHSQLFVDRVLGEAYDAGGFI
jgi:hypothetical protein